MQRRVRPADLWNVSAQQFKKSLPFRVRSRSALIGATVLLQAVVIGLGWLAIMKFARSGMESGVRDRLLDQTARAVAAANADLSRELAGPIPREGAEWDKAQRIVEQASADSGQTIVVLDLQGRLLCHPGLRANPAMTRIDYSEQMLTLSPDGERVELGQLRPSTPLAAFTDLLGGEAGVGVVYNPALRAKVVALDATTASPAAISRFTGGVMRWLGLGGAAVLLLTIVGSWLLVRLYDSVMMRANERLEIELELRVRRGLAIRDGLIFGLAKLADFRDTDTGRHLERIRAYSELLGQELLLSRRDIDGSWVELLKTASSLHDIGKVGVPDSVLLKPGALTAAERHIMQMHPVFGADTLIAIRARVGDDDLLNMSIQVALYHHERWDGTGYPHRLSGEQIPLCARVVALADMYDAVTSARVYKAAKTHEEARGLILEGRGSHFDPALVDAFEAVQHRFDELRMSMRTPDDQQLPPLPRLIESMHEAAKAA